MLKEIKDTETNLRRVSPRKPLRKWLTTVFSSWPPRSETQRPRRIFSHSRDVEDVHANLYKKAMNHVMEERETTYYVCTVCGYVSDGACPDTCPVCSASRNQ